MSLIPRLWSAATAAAASYLSRSSSTTVAIIGAGAAGLAAARAASRQGHDCIVLEKDAEGEGGIWKYSVDHAATRPMYRGLRTNLPRELMAFRELPWGGNQEEASFVSHEEVLRYLQRYCQEFGLDKMIRFGCNVTQVRLVENDTKVEVTWTTANNETRSDVFDAVMVCNGHFAIPFIPKLPGMEHFQGRVLHSIAYDDPREFSHENVLCIGAQSSGNDITREVSLYAKQVYVSDSNFKNKKKSKASKETLNANIVWLPRTVRIDPDATIHFADSTLVVRDVDTIIFCSGYDYDFAFLKNEENSRISLLVPGGERRVGMLYKGLWHATHPRLVSFIGLHQSIVPFPVFEVQAQAVVASWSSPSFFPSLEDRMVNAQRTFDLRTMILGDDQWEYCRDLAKMSGTYDDSEERYQKVNEGMYNHCGDHRSSIPPGSPDWYREVRYVRNNAEGTFRAVFPNGSTQPTRPHSNAKIEEAVATTT